MGSPPVASGAPRVWHASPHIAYVTPSRLATRTALSNSPSACACPSMSSPSDASHLPRGEGEGGGSGGKGGAKAEFASFAGWCRSYAVGM